MSQKKVADAFNKQFASAAHRIPQFIGVSDTTNIVDTTWRTDQVVTQFIVGLTELLAPLEKNGLVEVGFTKQAVTKAKLRTAVTTVIKNIKSGGSMYGSALQLQPWNSKSLATGSFYLRRASGGVGLTFRFISVGKGTGTGANDTKMLKVAFDMREAIYNEWLPKQQSLFTQLPKAGKPPGKGKRRRKAQGVITKHTQRAHEMNTTKGALALGVLKELRPSFDLDVFITNIDVIEQIENNIELNYARNFKKKKAGAFSFRFFIESSIRANKAGSEASDISSIKEKETKKAVNQLFIKEKGRLGALLARMDGSVAPVDQAAQDRIHDIVAPLTKGGKPDKRFKINKKISAKKFKSMKDSFEGKRGKSTPSKTSTKKYSVPIKSFKGKRPEKDKRNDTADLLKVETLINKRLPAQVRRNMGRPALINQTGRFSNSVQMGKLHQTKAGLSGEYTYQKSPYETFENTGSRRWPSGYNPKPLIAKSIRELAMQYTEQKLVSLRRR